MSASDRNNVANAVHYLNVGAPVSITCTSMPSRRKTDIQQMGKTDHIQQIGLNVIIGAFIEDGKSVYVLTYNDGQNRGDIRLRLLDMTGREVAFRAAGPNIGRKWFSHGKLSLIELDPELRDFRSPYRKGKAWKYFTDLNGTDCKVHICDDVMRDVRVGNPVQTMQMGGFRYGRVVNYDARDDTLLVKCVTPGPHFSDDDGRGALVTSLTNEGEVTAYGIIIGTDECQCTRVYPIGPPLQELSELYFAGRRLKICSPRSE